MRPFRPFCPLTSYQNQVPPLSPITSHLAPITYHLSPITYNPPLPHPSDPTDPTDPTDSPETTDPFKSLIYPKTNPRRLPMWKLAFPGARLKVVSPIPYHLSPITYIPPPSCRFFPVPFYSSKRQYCLLCNSVGNALILSIFRRKVV